MESCKLKDWGDSELTWLQQHLPQIPSDNTLVLVASSIDKRLKLWKYLSQHCQLQELNKPKPWDEHLGRLYYLKQEVQDLRLGMLGLCYTRLVQTDAALKRGARQEVVREVLMQCCL